MKFIFISNFILVRSLQIGVGSQDRKSFFSLLGPNGQDANINGTLVSANNTGANTFLQTPGLTAANITSGIQANNTASNLTLGGFNTDVADNSGSVRLGNVNLINFR